MSLLARSSRLWHTVRHLRAEQIYGRVWHRLHRPRVDASPSPPVAVPERDWVCCDRAPSMLAPDRFKFLNHEERIQENDWNSPQLPKLWLYNLHYFDDLVAREAASRLAWHRDLIGTWIQQNPAPIGNGWEPYCLSLRIVNWIKWRKAGGTMPHAASDRSMLDSLAVQTRYLRGRLERHLLGNHLWANLKALVFAGTFFEGPEARAWREEGLSRLRRELAEQILADGGHFELSPMYHSILLEDVLDLIQLSQVYPATFDEADVRSWHAHARAMLEWLEVMTHPDGGIAFFNDATFGIAQPLSTLRAYAAALGVGYEPAPMQPLRVLAASGYVRMQAGDAVLIADVGEVGPSYLPGHAHADTLSFEFSLGARRVLVNAGTSRYDTGPERLWERGTSSRNTVQIDHENSSEVWSSFRVARRAHPFDVASGQTDSVIWLTAAHDGYRRLPGRPVHRRRWELSAGRLTVTDTVEGGFAQAIARFLVAPPMQATAGRLEGSGRTLHWQVEPERARIRSGRYHPGFGLTQATSVIEAECGADGRLSTVFTWAN